MPICDHLQMDDDRVPPRPPGEPVRVDPAATGEPHDVLAAEEFALPVPAPGAEAPTDPSGIAAPHDVLAADEFALPTPGRAPVPVDPLGTDEPHDVLAAEDFALPAPGPARSAPTSSPRAGVRRVAPVGLAAAALLAAVAWVLRGRR